MNADRSDRIRCAEASETISLLFVEACGVVQVLATATK